MSANEKIPSLQVKPGQVVHLRPSEIIAHPVIAYLEQNGVFVITDEEVRKIAASAARIDFLQPIVVTLGPDGHYLRVIGRRRIKAAKLLGVTVPAYVREFSSEEEIIEAWRTENFVRAHYTAKDQMVETEKIEKIWSRRTRHRIRKASQLHSNLQALVLEGKLNMRGDEDLISSLAELPHDVQEIIAETIRSAGTNTIEFKEKIVSVVKDEELQKQLKEKDRLLASLNTELEEKRRQLKIKTLEIADLTKIDNKGTGVEIESIQEAAEITKKSLQIEIKNRDARIAELEKEKRLLYEQMTERVRDTAAEITHIIRQKIERMKNDALNAISGIQHEIADLGINESTRINILLILDSIEKARTEIVKRIDELDNRTKEEIKAVEARISRPSTIY